MAETPPLTLSGWINPRLPTAAPASSSTGGLPTAAAASSIRYFRYGALRTCCPPTAMTDGSVGLAGGEEIDGRPLNRPSSPAVDPQIGASKSRCPFTAVTYGSGGLAGGGGDPSPKPITDPYLITRGYWGASFEWGDSDSDEGEAWEEMKVEKGESSQESVASKKMEVEVCSPSQSSSVSWRPFFLPFPMEGEAWEAAVKEAERQMKEEGIWSMETDDDSSKRL